MIPEKNNDIEKHSQTALALMLKHHVSPLPENYTVWYHYAIGKNKELMREVDIILQKNLPFTPETGSYLYNKYIVGHKDNKVVDETAGNAQKVLLEVLKVMNDFSGETKDYNKGVDQYIDQISKVAGDGGGDMKSIVKQLIAATTNLKQSGEKISKKLDESKHEIDTLKKSLQQVTTEAQRDFLTGVFNRKTFEKLIDEEMLHANEKKSDLCLMMIDIDHFKQFNDKFGHLLGDEVLKTVARTLTHTLKGRDIVARFGGEEFIVMLPETPVNGAMKVADEVRQSIASKELKRKDTGENFGRITVSIGISRFRHDQDTLPLFTKRADDALYQSKHNGRNRVTFEAV